MVGLVEPSLDRKPAVRSKEAIGKAIEGILKKVQNLNSKRTRGIKGSLKRAFRCNFRGR